MSILEFEWKQKAKEKSSRVKIMWIIRVNSCMILIASPILFKRTQASNLPTIKANKAETRLNSTDRHMRM